jgi:cytoskeletal protein CcmA (bactofilin family)
MFNSKSNKNLGKSVESFETIIGASLRVDGNLLLRSSVRIDGLVHGNILQEDGCEATVAVAKGAIVTGDIRAKHVIISGTLQGNIFSSDRVELLETAFVSGDITYGTLGMQVGARLEGKLCQVDSDASLQRADKLISQVMQKTNAT